MRIQLSTLAFAALCSGCIMGIPVEEQGSAPGPLPYAAVRAAPAAGTEPIMLTAAFSGVFLITDDCVLFRQRGGEPILPLFFDGTTVGRDARGPYVRDGKTQQKFYDGDAFEGGGGSYPWDILQQRGNTRSPVPGSCAAQADYERLTSINPGFALANWYVSYD